MSNSNLLVTTSSPKVRELIVPVAPEEEPVIVSDDTKVPVLIT